jgi:hypothetical protein
MSMDVYLIPVGAERYELYCEHLADEASLSADVPAGTGRFSAMLHRFKAAVARVEEEQQRGTETVPDEGAGWQERMKRRTLRVIAEKVAEQRLLWRIRKESDVTLFHPDDLVPDRAMAIARGMLQREADRHLKWIIIDGALFCLSGIVAIVPGPNAIAYYFGFRFIGHYLAYRGARHGLNNVRWRCDPSGALTLLRRAVPLDAPDRERQVHEVASTLRLQHLARFFARTAVPAA